VHADADHHRCVVTAAGARLEEVTARLFDRAALAVARIDLRRHAGLHPRVGAADVLPLVPLGGSSMAAAVEAAHGLGERIWSELRVPVYFYGEAAGGRRLADVRAGRARPDLGGAAHPSAGAACVGARPPIVAYNVAFAGLGAAEGRRLAAAMRELPGVQALAFPLPGGRKQVSMNLTRLDETGVAAAHDRLSELAGRPGEPERVGLCPAAAAGPGCDGRLLEARLAAQAARLAAAAAEGRGEAEPALLAVRLRATAGSLGALAAGQESVLSGAEQAAALPGTLRAGGLLTPDLEALLGVAAAGLRRAVAPATAARFPGRVDLIDRWLGLA
jgi:glutamate formiminotransferase